jgi:serine protease Do
MQHIIIKHISGSRAKQVNEFPVDQFKVLTLGRDTTQAIQYDPEKDDLVSREHARISREEGREDRFLITDLNSRNGTYVNKQRVFGTASIAPGDIIQLGPGGPEFQFDLEPRPESMMRPTREANPVPIRETREAAASTSPSSSGSLTKIPVGRATVERMFGQYQQSSRKTLINLAAAIVGGIGIVAGVLLYLNLFTQKKLDIRYKNLDEQLRITQDMMKDVSQTASPIDVIKNPAEIVKASGQSTVFIGVNWKLIHTESRQQVYHHHECNGKYPAYLKIKDKYYPWLSLDDENGTNQPIGMSLTGSGFVVTNNGFILTNRHIAAPWRTRYLLHFDKPVVFTVDQVNFNTYKILYKKCPDPVSDEEKRFIEYQLTQSEDQWVPANEALLVKKEKNEYYLQPRNRQFDGHLDLLYVTFRKDKSHIPARLVRISDQHDVALLKVDVPGSVEHVAMYDSYNESRPGDVITVLSYPATSPDVTVRTRSQDPFNPSPQDVKVPDITVTNGLIGKIIRGEATPKGGAAYDYYSEIGDVFQLTVDVGRGSSGGPVFNSHGHVIGIFFASTRDTQIGFAVPIRHGRELIEIKPVLE